MDIPDIDKDIVIMQTEKHGDIFNMQKTLDHPDFITYYKYRKKLPDKPVKDYTKRFGVDLTRHFEIGYQVLKVFEDSGDYEIYAEDEEGNSKHPFDVPDEEL